MRTGKGLETMNGAFENHPPPFSSSGLLRLRTAAVRRVSVWRFGGN
jgi:hypothetical protein